MPPEGLALPALPPAAEPFVLAAWVAASLLLAAAGVGAHVRIRRRCSGGERTTVEGATVVLSERTGPAVVGLLDPVVVLPRWVGELPADRRRLVVRHELEHRRARDPALLALGFAVLAVMPWNAALWWIVRRLQLAVELDCDRRVLADGVSPREYGGLLLDVKRHRWTEAIPAVALGERSSRLERRIRAMTDANPNHRGARALVLGMSVAGLLAAACDVPTPAESPDSRGDEAAATRSADAPSGIRDQRQDLRRQADGIRLRGDAAVDLSEDSPLILLDGERVEDGSRRLDELRPDEIRSIEVTQGPAAVTSYGEEARDGVIIITTEAAGGEGEPAGR